MCSRVFGTHYLPYQRAPSQSFCHLLSILLCSSFSIPSLSCTLSSSRPCSCLSKLFHLSFQKHRLPQMGNPGDQLNNSSGWPQSQALPSDQSVEVCLTCASAQNVTLWESVRINEFMIHYMCHGVWLTVRFAKVWQYYVWVRNCSHKLCVGRTEASPKD